MWFSMPNGCEGISVELQSFATEIKDEKGKSYFRAPDHFAPRILAISGFAIAEPPAGAPADLPKADPLRDGAIAESVRANEALKIENQNLRTDLNSALAKIASLANDKTELMKDLEKSNAELEGLKEKIDDETFANVAQLKKAK